MNEKRINKECYADSPVAWFVVLERARHDRDFELAAKAKQELIRLGVSVKYKKLALRRRQGGKR